MLLKLFPISLFGIKLTNLIYIPTIQKKKKKENLDLKGLEREFSCYKDENLIVPEAT